MNRLLLGAFLVIGVVAGCTPGQSSAPAAASSKVERAAAARTMTEAFSDADRAQAELSRADLTFADRLAEVGSSLKEVRVALGDTRRASCGEVETAVGLVEVRQGTVEVMQGHVEQDVSYARDMAALLRKSAATLSANLPAVTQSAELDDLVDQVSTAADRWSAKVNTATAEALHQADADVDRAAAAVTDARALADRCA